MGDLVKMNGNGEETTAEQLPEQHRSRGPAVNEVRLMGRLAANPEMRYTPRGTPVTEFRVATNELPEAEFHDVACYGKLASAVAEFQQKGGLVYISGRLHADQWKTAEGSPRRRVVVIAESVQFLSRRAEEPES